MSRMLLVFALALAGCKAIAGYDKAQPAPPVATRCPDMPWERLPATGYGGPSLAESRCFDLDLDYSGDTSSLQIIVTAARAPDATTEATPIPPLDEPTLKAEGRRRYFLPANMRVLDVHLHLEDPLGRSFFASVLAVERSQLRWPPVGSPKHTLSLKITPGPARADTSPHQFVLAPPVAHWLEHDNSNTTHITTATRPAEALSIDLPAPSTGVAVSQFDPASGQLLAFGSQSWAQGAPPQEAEVRLQASTRISIDPLDGLLRGFAAAAAFWPLDEDIGRIFPAQPSWIFPDNAPGALTCHVAVGDKGLKAFWAFPEPSEVLPQPRPHLLGCAEPMLTRPAGTWQSCRLPAPLEPPGWEPTSTVLVADSNPEESNRTVLLATLKRANGREGYDEVWTAIQLGQASMDAKLPPPFDGLLKKTLEGQPHELHLAASYGDQSSAQSSIPSPLMGDASRFAETVAFTPLVCGPPQIVAGAPAAGLSEPAISNDGMQLYAVLRTGTNNPLQRFDRTGDDAAFVDSGWTLPPSLGGKSDPTLFAWNGTRYMIAVAPPAGAAPGVLVPRSLALWQWVTSSNQWERVGDLALTIPALADRMHEVDMDGPSVRVDPATGKLVMIFSLCIGVSNNVCPQGPADIYQATPVDSNISLLAWEARKLEFEGGQQHVDDPCLGPDGLTLVFGQKTTGSNEGFTLYVAQRTSLSEARATTPQPIVFETPPIKPYAPELHQRTDGKLELFFGAEEPPLNGSVPARYLYHALCQWAPPS